MQGGSDSGRKGPTFTDVELAWIGSHLTELRQTAVGEGIVYWSLAIAFVAGLAAHIGGYLLRSTLAGEPLGLVADLLYALGWSLWTGVVVVVAVQVWPAAKRRQIKEALDMYEAASREIAAGTAARTAKNEKSHDEGS
jgi:hypothetical protein